MNAQVPPRNAPWSIGDTAARLALVLGLETIATIAAADVAGIRRWISGNERPSEEAERRIRAAHEILDLLRASMPDAEILAWFLMPPASGIAAGHGDELLEYARLRSTARSSSVTEVRGILAAGRGEGAGHGHH